MFKTQSYKEKLSFYNNDNVDDIVNIAVTLNTNHEIDKNILVNISDIISKMFITNYTNMDEIAKLASIEKLKVKEDKQKEKDDKKDEMIQRRQKRDDAKRQWDDHQENTRLMKEADLKQKNILKEAIKIKESKPKATHWKRKP